MNLPHLWSVATLTGSRVMAMMLNLVAMTVIARSLGPHELGIWSIMLALHAYGVHLGEFGLRSVVTAEAGYVGGACRHLIANYLSLRLSISGIVFVMAIVASAFMPPDMRLAAVVMAASLFAVSLQLDWIALARNHAIEAGLLLLVRPLAMLTLTMLVSGLEHASSVAMIFTASWSLSALVSSITLRAPPPAAAELLRAPTLLHLGLPLMASTLISQAQANLDLLFVGYAFGTREAGYYYLATAIVTAALVPANAMGQLAMARLAPLRGQMDVFRRRLARELGLAACLALSGAAALALLGPFLLPMIFGNAFAPAAGPMLYLLPWLVLASLTSVTQGALIAIRRQKTVLWANIAMLGMLALALPLAGRSGLLEAFAISRAVAECTRLAMLLAPMLAGTMPESASTPTEQPVGAGR
ncbi:MAG: lipopolysaccharide biosynthesis protein [Geminicoccaceae bacterium]|nr:lipopolysaccharide biosynthesis protein [Geminicoccaceae bacterium]